MNINEQMNINYQILFSNILSDNEKVIEIKKNNIILK